MIDLINIIFNSVKIKFDILDREYSENGILSDSSKKVNIFLNMEVVYRKLSHIKENVSDMKDVMECLLSNMLNYAAHYRLYYAKRGYYSKVYLYFPHPMIDSGDYYKNIYSGYRKHTRKNNQSKHTSILTLAIWEDMVDIVQTITNYFPNIYTIISGNLEPSTIPFILHDTENYNILVTTQEYEFQYVNYGFHILYCGRTPTILHNGNIMNYLYTVNNIKDIEYLSPEFLPIIVAIKGDPIRNIKGFRGLGFSRICQSLLKGISLRKIPNSFVSIESILPLFKDEYMLKIQDNFRVSSINRMVSSLYDGDILSIKRQVIDNFDDESLKRLGSEYFQKYPIELNYLTSVPRANIKW